ncbi:MAG: DNA double-strand break repair nuclease NurA [Thermoprotei archaeon]|nr:DNA double-strand break repair nuclease NurA [Thermoprotei archaeon]
MDFVVGGGALAALSRLAMALRNVSVRGFIVRSVLRLEDALWLREPVEDSGDFVARVYEYSSRPLRARRPFPGKGFKFTPLGLDSSSRVLETSAADIIIGGVSVSSSRGFPGFTWPSWGEPVFKDVHPIFYLLPNFEGSIELGDPLVSTVNSAGIPFDINYSVGEAADEMRVSMENWALRCSLDVVEDLEDPVVMVDGPLYTVVKALVLKGVSENVSAVWAKLLNERVEAIKALESRGVPVIGVVKRVEKSTILSKTRGFSYLTGNNALEGDKSVVLKMFANIEDKIPGRIYVTPKILVKAPRGVEADDKIIEYIVIPPGKYQFNISFSRVYRVEYTLKSLKILESKGLDPIQVTAMDSVASGSLEPLSIKMSDVRSSRITQAFKGELARKIASLKAPLSYWSLKEAAWGWES